MKFYSPSLRHIHGYQQSDIVANCSVASHLVYIHTHLPLRQQSPLWCAATLILGENVITFDPFGSRLAVRASMMYDAR